MKDRLMKMILIIFGAFIFTLGFICGMSFTHGQYMGLVDKISTGVENAIQIERIEIDFNETQIIDSLTDYIESYNNESYKNSIMVK